MKMSFRHFCGSDLLKDILLCFPSGARFGSASERSSSAPMSVKWFRLQKPPLSFWCLRSLCTSKWAFPKRWATKWKPSTLPPAPLSDNVRAIWPATDLLPRRTSPSECRDHQLLQQEHQRHQRFRWERVRGSDLCLHAPRDVTSC